MSDSVIHSQGGFHVSVSVAGMEVINSRSATNEETIQISFTWLDDKNDFQSADGAPQVPNNLFPNRSPDMGTV